MKLKNIINIVLVATCFSSTGFAKHNESKTESKQDKKESLVRPVVELVVFATLATWFYGFAISAEEPLKRTFTYSPNALKELKEKTNLTFLDAWNINLPNQLKPFNSKVIVAIASYFALEGFNKAFTNKEVSCDDANAIATATINRAKRKRKKADEELAEIAVDMAPDAGAEGGCGCC